LTVVVRSWVVAAIRALIFDAMLYASGSRCGQFPWITAMIVRRGRRLTQGSSSDKRDLVSIRER
jgi:hypothetical protein